MHGEEGDAHIESTDTESRGCDRANRRAARHGVVRYEFLIVDAGLTTVTRPLGGTHRIRGIPLVRVDFEQGATIDHGTVDRVVALRVVRVHCVASVRRQAPRVGESASAVRYGGPGGSIDPGQHAFEEGPTGTGASFAADLFMIERGKKRDRARGSASCRNASRHSEQRDQPGVHRRQVVQAAGCEESPIESEHPGGGSVRRDDVVADDVFPSAAGQTREVGNDIRVCEVPDADHGVQVLLGIEDESLAVDPAVEVHGKLREPQEWPGTHE